MAGKEIPIATVYAESLYQIGIEQNRLDTLTEEVRALSDMLDVEPRFTFFLDAPNVSIDEKRASVERIFKGRVSDIFINFLCVVIDKRRAPLLKQMTVAFGEILDKHNGLERGQAITAVPLTEEEHRALEAWVRKRSGRDFTMTAKVDPDLIGGIVLKMGDRVLDASVRTQIKEIRERMLSKHAH